MLTLSITDLEDFIKSAPDPVYGRADPSACPIAAALVSAFDFDVIAVTCRRVTAGRHRAGYSGPTPAWAARYIELFDALFDAEEHIVPPPVQQLDQAWALCALEMVRQEGCLDNPEPITLYLQEDDDDE